MSASDVQETLDQAIALTGRDGLPVRHRPSLHSDNAPAYVSSELRDYLTEQGITRTRGATYHPQTPGKVERWHRPMKFVVKPQNYYFPSQLEKSPRDFISYYKNVRCHESFNDATPAGVYFGRDSAVLSERERIKRRTMKLRKKKYRVAVAA